jgi:Glycosyl hydrolase family 26
MSRARRRGPLYLVIPWLLVVTIAGLLAGQLLLQDGESRPAARPTGVAVTPSRDAGLMLGVTTVALARNSFSPWRQNGLDSVEEFERHANSHASVVMWYADWATVRRPDLRQLRAIARRGSLPEITWEPWNHTWDSAVQPTYRLRRIIDGRHDRLIRRWARDLAAYRGPVRLRFAHEMNGNWYPWSEAANRNRPGEFAKAWRRVWRIFKQEGAANVEWVWSPVAFKIKKREYPGHAYVDRVGLSGFVGGVQLRHRPWRSFVKLFGDSLSQLGTVAREKPIEISEVGVAERGGDKPAWILGMFRALARRPTIDTLIWFNLDKGSDWRIQSSVASARSFQAGVRDPRVGQQAGRFTLRNRADGRNRRRPAG